MTIYSKSCYYLLLTTVLSILFGCAPTTKIQTVKAPVDFNKPLERIYVIEQMGIAADTEVHAFEKNLSSALKVCGIDATLYRIEQMPTTESDKNKLQAEIKEQVVQYKPDAILEVNELSYIAYSRNNIPSGTAPSKYGFALNTMQGQKVWAAEIEPKGFSHVEDLYSIIATDGVKAMQKDGIIHTCPTNVDTTK